MIQVIKLITGEQFIGDLSVDGRYGVKNPCMLQIVPARHNPEASAIALIPAAMHLEDATIFLKEEHVLWIAHPVKELFNQYNSAFGTGIQLSGM